MKPLYIYLLSLCMLACASCAPEKNEGDDKGNGGGTEQPVLPPVTPPTDPDAPEENPDDDSDDPGNPGLPPDDGGNPGGGGDPMPQPDPPYAEEIFEYYGINLVTSPPPASYQLIPTSNPIIQAPDWWPVRPYFDPPYSGWHTYNLSGSKYALTSYIYDSEDGTQGDNWLITDGIQVQGNKSVLSWIAEAATAFPESYEVYLSTSSQLEHIKGLEPIYTCDQLVERAEPTKHITDVNYLLTGYQGQTIYLAFRHNTKGAFKLVMNLSKLSASTFPYDLQDLEVKSSLCWKATQPMIRGNMYPAGAELTVQMTVRNAGYLLTNTPLELSYTSNGQTVTEKTNPITLNHGSTYTHTFKKTTTYTGEQYIVVNVKPLPDEQRTYANNSYIKLATPATTRRLAKVLYEEAAATSCSVCEKFIRLKSFENLDKMVPERTVAVFTMSNRDAQKAYPAEIGDQYVQMLCAVSKVPGWPNMTINRDPKYAYPNYRKLACDYVDVPNILTVLDDEYAYEAYQPLDIRATHRYSADLKTMHVDVTVTAEEDYAAGDLGVGAMILEDKVYHKNYTIVGAIPVYNHLTRAVLGDVKQGVRGVIPTAVKAGETFTYTFDYSVPEFYTELKPNLDELYAVVMIIKGNGLLMTCDKSAKRTASTPARVGSPWLR